MAGALRVEIIPVVNNAKITEQLNKTQQKFNEKKFDIPLKVSKSGKKDLEDTTSKFQELIQAVGKVAIWTVATSAIFGTIRAVKQLVEQFTLLEDQLIAIERVTKGLALEKVFDLSLSASNMLAVGFEELLAVTEELGRTYSDLDEVQLSLAASNAMLLQSVTDLNADSAISGLIAITQAYNIAIEDSISVVDALNVVNNNYAIGAADLSASLERSAAAASEVGVSFENLIGYTTAIKTSTRESGSVIGNSLKTITVRLQSNSDALREVQQAGVDVYGENGQLRSAEDIIADLAGKWDGLSKNQKINIGVAAAGQRQYTRFAALMQNFDIATSAANDAISNQGNAMVENEKRLKTIMAQSQILKNNIIELAKEFGETLKPIIVALIKVLDALVSVLTFVFDQFGHGIMIVGAVTLGMWKVVPALKSLITWYTALGGVAATTNAIMSAIPAVAIAIAIGFLIKETIELINKNKELKAIQEKSIESVMNESSKIDELTKRYRELKNTVDLTTEQQQEITDIQNELVALMPSLIHYTDEYGNSIIMANEALEDYIGLLKEEALEKAKKDMSEYTEQVRSADKAIKAFSKTHVGGFAKNDMEWVSSAKGWDYYIDSLEDINRLRNAGAIGAEYAVKLANDYSELLVSNKDKFLDYSDALKTVTFGTNDLNEETTNAINIFDNMLYANSSLYTDLNKLSLTYETLLYDLKAGTESTEALSVAFGILGVSYDDFATQIENTPNIGFTTDELNSYDTFKSILSDINGINSDNIEAISKSIQIMDLYGNSTSLSTQQQIEYNRAIGYLSDIFPEYSGNIEDNMKMIKKYSEFLSLANDNQEEYINGIISGAIPATGSLTSQIKALQRTLGSEDLFSTLLDKQDEYFSSITSGLEKEKEEFSNMIDYQIDELDRLQDEIEFDENIDDLTSDRIDLEKQIARLQNDTTVEGIAKRKKLEEELAETKEDIDKEFRDRDFELQKQNLETLKDLIENDYDLRIQKEEELNEIIKERITAQSDAIKADMESLKAIDEIINRADSFGIGTLLRGMVDSGIFNLSGIDGVPTKTPEKPGGKEASTIFQIETINFDKNTSESDIKAMVDQLLNYSEQRGVTSLVKNIR